MPEMRQEVKGCRGQKDRIRQDMPEEDEGREDKKATILKKFHNMMCYSLLLPIVVV